MPSRRSRREKNRAKKIAKLNDDSCANDRESQEWQDNECEERDSFQEAREKKNTFERNRYKANSESKKDNMKAYYDQNRELILASKQIWTSIHISHVYVLCCFMHLIQWVQ